MRVIRYIYSQGSVLAAYFGLHIQLLGTAYRGSCILTATDVIEFWEEGVSRRHGGLVLSTAVANVLSAHILFDSDILHLILVLNLQV